MWVKQVARKAANPPDRRAWTGEDRAEPEGRQPEPSYGLAPAVPIEAFMNVMNRRIPDRYVRWCERTGRELIPIFLLDFGFNSKKL